MSLKLRTRCRWCQSQFRGWDVLKTVEMAIWHKKADDMNGIRESFLSLNLFSLSFKIYFMALLRWAIAPIAPPHGSVTEWDFSQNKSYTCWQHLAVKSTLVFDFVVRTSCPPMNKSKVQSRSASGTSPLKLIAKTVRYQDASFPARNCELAYRSSRCYDSDCSSSVSTKLWSALQ